MLLMKIRNRNGLFWSFIFITSLSFYYLNVPAGWLLGSLFASMLYRLFVNSMKPHKQLFSIALGLIGLTLGSMLDLMLLWQAANRFLLALVVGLVLTLTGGWALGYMLFRFSSLDRKTAFYSFIPGGASEVLGLADRQGANVPIVATFHTARILLFVSVLPFLAGNENGRSLPTSLVEDVLLNKEFVIVILVLLVAAIGVNRFFPLPAGPLFYATLLALVWNMGGSFEVPILATGMGQMFIGANIGLQFNRHTFRILKSVGLLGVSSLLLMLGICLGVGSVFSAWTQVDFWSAVLGWAPAGAGEMSSTAILLNMDVSAVIMIQFVRLYTVFFSLPLFSRWLNIKDMR